MKNILIIGGTGRIGSFFIKNVLKRNCGCFSKIFSLSRNRKQHEQLPNVTYLYEENWNENYLDTILIVNNIQVILYTPNLLTRNGNITTLLACSKRYDIPVLFVGSAAIFTEIPNAKTRGYRIEKEREIRESGIWYTIVRPTMIFGHIRDENIFKLKRIVNKFPLLILPGGKNTKQCPIDINDLVEAMRLLICKRGIKKEEINLAGPRPLTMKEIIISLSEKKKLVVYLNPKLIILILRIGRKIGIKTWHHEKIQRFNEDKIQDESHIYLEQYGYKPRPFAESVKAYQANN